MHPLESSAPSRGTYRGGEGEPLLLVHGITDTWRSWELVIPALERHHDVLAITLLGHSGGREPGPGDEISLQALADEAERDMDAAGFETAHIAGNSLGGWIALELAARGRARSVVPLAPSGGWEGRNLHATMTLVEFMINQYSLKLLGDRAGQLAARPGTRALALGRLVSKPGRVPAPLAAALIQGAADCPAVVPLLMETRGRGYPDLDAIGCRVRIVWGTEDKILPQKHLSSRFRRILPDAEWIELEGCGHLVQVDRPEQTVELILEVSSGTAATAAPT